MVVDISVLKNILRFFIISFYIILYLKYNFVLNVLPYQNTEKFMIYFSNIPFVVCHKLAKFELKKIPLAH
jgi:hypothetical protein